MKIDVEQILKDSFKETIDEGLKQELSKYILNTLLPIAEEAGNNFVKQIQEQSKEETGWVKFRDSIVLPFIILGVIWLVKTTLTKTYNSIEESHDKQ
jgi:hypothetical protein